MKGERPDWLRWLMLAVAIGLCWAVWMDIQEYAYLARLDIFSRELWAEIVVRRRFFWVNQGMLAIIFFYQFAVWRRDGKSRAALLSDGVLFSVLGAAWACLYWIIPMEGAPRALWVQWLILLAVLVFGAGHQWRKYLRIIRNT